jgi:group I intron endonuclease
MSARILCGIYRIRNTINGRVYVGSAVNLADRWRLHRRQLDRGTHHCPPLQRAWVKYGEIAFIFEFIEAVERNKEALDLREQVYLDEVFASGLAYNICRIPGSALGVKRSAEHCARTSAAKRGRKLSAGHRASLAAAKLGSKQSAETVAKRLAKTRGRKRSPEQCVRISDGQRGRKHSAETLAKISAGKLGSKQSAETVAKRVATLRGRKRSAEQRAQMSTHWVELNGQRASITDWAKSLGTTTGTLRYRLARWPLARALTEPRRKRRRAGAETLAKMSAAQRARYL